MGKKYVGCLLGQIILLIFLLLEFIFGFNCPYTTLFKVINFYKNKPSLSSSEIILF